MITERKRGLRVRMMSETNRSSGSSDFHVETRWEWTRQWPTAWPRGGPFRCCRREGLFVAGAPCVTGTAPMRSRRAGNGGPHSGRKNRGSVSISLVVSAQARAPAPLSIASKPDEPRFARSRVSLADRGCRVAGKFDYARGTSRKSNGQ